MAHGDRLEAGLIVWRSTWTAGEVRGHQTSGIGCGPLVSNALRAGSVKMLLMKRCCPIWQRSPARARPTSRRPDQISQSR